MATRGRCTTWKKTKKTFLLFFRVKTRAGWSPEMCQVGRIPLPLPVWSARLLCKQGKTETIQSPSQCKHQQKERGKNIKKSSFVFRFL